MQVFFFLSMIQNELRRKSNFIIETGFFFYSLTELSEEWALATSLKDLSENQYDVDDETESETFALKYLGNTVIESARSEEATAEAVKAIISTAKGIHDRNVNYTIGETNNFFVFFFFLLQPPTENCKESI